MAGKEKRSSFWTNLPFKGYFYASVAFNLLTILIIIVFRTFLPPVAPLLYGRPEGLPQLVSTYWLISAPALALALTIVNMFLTRPVKDKFMQAILVISTFLFSALTTITILKIVFLVGFF